MLVMIVMMMVVMLVMVVMVVMVSPDFRMLWMSGVVYWAVRGEMRVLMELRGRKGDMEQEMVVAYNNSVEE